MAKKQSKKPIKTRLQMLMDQEHEVNNCQKCKTRVITIKNATSKCVMCGSTDILKEFWV